MVKAMTKNITGKNFGTAASAPTPSICHTHRVQRARQRLQDVAEPQGTQKHSEGFPKRGAI